MSGNKNKEKTTIIENFKNDKIFSQFFTKDFDVLKFTHQSINEQKLLENNAKLQEGIQMLNQELHLQVNEHYADLLEQATIIRDLEDMLIIVRSGIDSLENSVSLVKGELKDPYLQIKEKTRELERIQNAAEILRKVLRFCFVCGKLRKHLGSSSAASSLALSPNSNHSNAINIHTSRELPKAASCLYELEQIQKNFDLSGIEIVEREMEWILKIGQEIQQKAEQMLVSGLETQNQSEVANSLQIFYNLKRLNDTITQTLRVIEEKALSSIREVLESSVIEQGNASQVAAWKSALWVRIEKLSDVLHQFCIQVWHLQKVLQKMRDPTTHSSLYDILISEFGSSITKSFWKNLSNSLSKEFVYFAQRSQLIESTFISEYPKLIRIFNEFLKRLQTNVEVKGAKETHFVEETAILLGGLSHFENLYIQKLSARLLESINRMFPPGTKSSPSPEEVNNFSKLLYQELDLSQCGPHLYTSVSKYIAKTLTLFAQKCTLLISTEQDAYQVSEKNSSSQLKNSSIFNSVIVLHTSLVNLLKQTPPNVQQELNQPIEALYTICCNILNPLFHKVSELFDRTLLSMHQNDYAATDNQLSMNSDVTSKHILILQKQITTFKNINLAPYTYCPLLADRIKSLTERILLFFVRHAALLRPLSDHGKLKLAGDTAQLELSLAPLRQVKTMGAAYQALRAFRPLLFRETDQILGASELELLSPIDVCHHLLSRAPPEIKSPHERMGVSIQKYSIWMDSHSEKDIWVQIQKSLDIYAKQVNERGESHYDPVYPVLMELGNQIMSK